MKHLGILVFLFMNILCWRLNEKIGWWVGGLVVFENRYEFWWGKEVGRKIF